MKFIDLYDLFVFDLDGTLARTREDLAESVNHALERIGQPRRALEEVTRFIGNGARLHLERALGPKASEPLLAEGLRIFLEHYEEHCLDRTKLYPGVLEVTAALAGAGKTLTVLTNKPTSMSLKILRGLGVADRFVRIDGADSFARKKPDPMGLQDHMAGCSIPPGRTLMIGDSAVDAATARAAGTACAGALWGFKPEEFDAEPPDHFLRSMEDLLGPALTERL